MESFNNLFNRPTEQFRFCQWNKQNLELSAYLPQEQDYKNAVSVLGQMGPKLATIVLQTPLPCSPLTIIQFSPHLLPIPALHCSQKGENPPGCRCLKVPPHQTF